MHITHEDNMQPLTAEERRKLVETPITVHHYGGGYHWCGASSGEPLVHHSGRAEYEDGSFENVVDLYER